MTTRALGIFLFAINVCACGSASTPAKTNTGSNSTSGATTVTLANTAFSVSTLTVTAGTTVTFANNDSTAHDIASLTPSPDVFDLQNQNPGATTTHTFSVKGTIPVICNYHSTMKLTVTVD